MSSPEPLPLPRSWPNHVRVGMLHVLSLAQFSLACAEAKLAKRLKLRNRLRAENDRLRQEVELLHEERRIKNARMLRLPPQKRPHYLPLERMAILELRAARGWNTEQTAAVFHVTQATIADWMSRLATAGTEAFVGLKQPVNKFPEFVREVVCRLKTLCPRLGKRKLAETLARAGLHLGATTVRNMLRETKRRPTAPTDTKAAKPKRKVTAKSPNKVWHVDLTLVPTLLGFWTAWLPFALPQHWPFCYWLAVVTDHFSRRVQAVQTFERQPTGRDVRQFLGRTMRQLRVKPRYFISDRGRQFWCKGFKAWCNQRNIRPRFGAIGQHGGIALVERLIRTLKEEFIAERLVPTRRREFQQELDRFVSWFNAYRPHAALNGRTPNEVYYFRKAANRKPRLEPRATWPRASPCAEPPAKVRGQCGQKFSLHVRFHAGRKQLPIVTLRKSA